MPRLWDATITSHREAVRNAVIESTLALVRQRGLRGVTMSNVAEAAGIGRATLYKYFPDVESILGAWHAEQVSRHLQRLETEAASSDRSFDRLEAVLAAYADIVRRSRRHRDDEVATILHRDRRVAGAEARLHALIERSVAEAAADGRARADVPAAELAWFAIRSLDAASDLRSAEAVTRLVRVTIDGLACPVIDRPRGRL